MSDRRKKRFTVDELFSDTRPQAVGVRDLTEAKEIDLSRIVPDPKQPRRTFDQDRLDELVASIQAEGILQPIVVRFDSDGNRYIIVHGERRFRAAKHLNLKSIPALVRDVPAERRLLQQLMENVVRDDLNAIDRAAALRELKGQLGDPPWEDVAAAVGIKRSRLFQLLGTGNLSAQTQTDIQAGRLSEKQSRLLQGLSPEKQDALRELLIQESVPGPVATRLARAFRDVPLKQADAASAQTALKNLYHLVAPADATSQRQQTSMLLQTIRSSAADASLEKRRKQLASLVSAPSWSTSRFGKDLASFIRTLVAAPIETLRTDEQAKASLRELRDALDALLNEKS